MSRPSGLPFAHLLPALTSVILRLAFTLGLFSTAILVADPASEPATSINETVQSQTGPQQDAPGETTTAANNEPSSQPVAPTPTASEPEDDSSSVNAEPSPDSQTTTVAESNEADREPENGVGTIKHRAFVVPIEGPIATPQLYILRRALKDAITEGVDTVILDIDTPGGTLGTMLEMMEALVDRFEGETIAFVNPEAISAGAFISIACSRIYFAPRGIMGAAAAVSGTGEPIEETMEAKIKSYLQAKTRSITDESGRTRYRGDVIRAMSDLDWEFSIGETVIKHEGELLSLTADEAVAEYGDPAVPLLADGIAESVDAILTDLYGEGNFETVTFEVSWAEVLAKWFSNVAPLLIGIGFIFVVIEAYTPHFGVIGGIGVALILLGFSGSYVAGLAGYEPAILFGLGVILVLIELLVMPGVGLFFLLGTGAILGAMVWSMSDVWPTPGGGYDVEWTTLGGAFQLVILNLSFLLVAAIALARFVPKKLFAAIIHSGSSASLPAIDVGGGNSAHGQSSLPQPGEVGTVIRELRPIGVVEINGQRYEARAQHGNIEVDETVSVVGHQSFAITVKHIPHE